MLLTMKVLLHGAYSMLFQVPEHKYRIGYLRADNFADVQSGTAGEATVKAVLDDGTILYAERNGSRLAGPKSANRSLFRLSGTNRPRPGQLSNSRRRCPWYIHKQGWSNTLVRQDSAERSSTGS